jgi:hypothetical protein
MQAILRSYDRGEVKPTGDHIRAWNEQMRRRQRNLQTVVNAAQKYKRVLQDERRASSRGRAAADAAGSLASRAFQLVRAAVGLKPKAARARDDYLRAKENYLQEGKWEGAMIKRRPAGGAREGASALEQEEEAEERRQLARERAAERLQLTLPSLGALADRPFAGQACPRPPPPHTPLPRRRVPCLAS